MTPIDKTYAGLHCMCSEANIHETNDGLFQIINFKGNIFHWVGYRQLATISIKRDIFINTSMMNATFTLNL